MKTISKTVLICLFFLPAIFAKAQERSLHESFNAWKKHQENNAIVQTSNLLYKFKSLDEVKSETIKLKWNTTTNLFDSIGKIEFEYDNDRRLIVENHFDFDSIFILEYKLIHMYDSDDRIISTTTYVNSNNNLVPHAKDSSGFNVQGKKNYYVYYKFLNNQWELESGSKIQFVFTQDTLRQRIVESYQMGSWINNSNTEYIYDSTGNFYEILTSTFVNETWVPFDKFSDVKYLDNKLDYPESFIHSRYIFGNWAYNEKYEASYNANKQITNEKFYEYYAGDWDQVLRSTYNYDTYNNLTEVFDEGWYDQWELIYGQKIAYTYDNNDRILAQLFSYWDDKTDLYTDNEKFIHTYQLFVSSIQNSRRVDINAYPNPANEVLHINAEGLAGKTAVITLSDVTGRTVSGKEVKVFSGMLGTTVETGHLKKGIYILRINSDNTTGVYRVIKN